MAASCTTTTPTAATRRRGASPTTLTRNATDGTFTATNKDGSAQLFDSAGNLTGIKDRYGNTSTLTYTAGKLTAVSDPAGRGSLSFAYDTCSAGRLCSITDWMSPARTVSFGYDGSGRLTSATDREGKTTTYGYDGTSQRLTTITDANGHVAVTNAYDAQGRVSTQKDARGLTTGQQTTFAYVDNGNGTQTTTMTYPATSVDPAWNTTQADTYNLTTGFVTS
ncbi:MAG: hypothetical protein EXR51_05895 [Dehalococcoidia bacterium]|nr:hypothetical protein [Dehalococcoidia bacterium]